MSADSCQGGSPTSAQKEAIRIIEIYKNTRLEICTKIDSVFNIISDYPTLKTCKELAIIHVNGIIDILPQYVGSRAMFNPEIGKWKSILTEIEKM